jgi:hypothetical protein
MDAEREMTEESMQAVNAFQRAVIDGLPDPVMVIAPDHTIKLMNRAARDAFLVDASAPGPLLCYAVSHNKSMPCVDKDHPCPLDHVRESGRPFVVIHEHFLLTGEKRIIEVSATPLQGPDGGFCGIRCLC